MLGQKQYLPQPSTKLSRKDLLTLKHESDKLLEQHQALKAAVTTGCYHPFDKLVFTQSYHSGGYDYYASTDHYVKCTCCNASNLYHSEQHNFR